MTLYYIRNYAFFLIYLVTEPLFRSPHPHQISHLGSLDIIYVITPTNHQISSVTYYFPWPYALYLTYQLLITRILLVDRQKSSGSITL